MHHSMLIQGLLTNGTFERIDPYKYRNPTIASITVLFRSNPSFSPTWILLMCSRTLMTRSNNPSWLLLDRWNQCHPQHHDWWYHVLHIYEGFELWIFPDSVFPHTIDFTNALEIQSIFGFELSVRVKWLDNPRWFFLSTSCNQIVVTNGTMSHVLSMPTGYYTFSKFIEAVG